MVLGFSEYILQEYNHICIPYINFWQKEIKGNGTPLSTRIFNINKFLLEEIHTLIPKVAILRSKDEIFYYKMSIKKGMF